MRYALVTILCLILALPFWINAQTTVTLPGMTETTTFSASDILWIVINPGTTPQSRKIQASNLLKRNDIKSLTIFSPTTADTNKIQLYWPATTTMVRIACSTDSGSVSINFDERAEATPNTAGTNTLSSALICDTDSQVTTTFSDSTIAANVPQNLAITAISGTPGVVRIHVTGSN